LPKDANYAISTEYVFNGETLLSTFDQKLVNGAASGTAQTRYVLQITSAAPMS
jgi:hypothetical protein